MFGYMDRSGLFWRQVVVRVAIVFHQGAPVRVAGQLDGLRVNIVHRRKVGIALMHDHRLLLIEGCLSYFRVNSVGNLDFAAHLGQFNAVRARVSSGCRVDLRHVVHHVIAGKVMIVPESWCGERSTTTSL